MRKATRIETIFLRRVLGHTVRSAVKIRINVSAPKGEGKQLQLVIDQKIAFAKSFQSLSLGLTFTPLALGRDVQL